ncbi:MAG: TfoX/Sxy family protein [Vogesella sp.]|nr:TfoX/Sxy family protein [Vogesella sp.]
MCHAADSTLAAAPRYTGNMDNTVNLGPASWRLLQAAGVADLAALRQLGAVAAYLQVKRSGQHASLNLLWALEGALSGRHWQQVARDDRLRLLLALEDLEKMHD